MLTEFELLASCFPKVPVPSGQHGDGAGSFVNRPPAAALQGNLPVRPVFPRYGPIR
jgi:hypothetical protein